jgi:hypothetical protein
MNTNQRDGDPADALLDEVDFKWLMAGQGHWVDTARLRSDANYAHFCVDAAMHSPCPALHRFAHAFDHPANEAWGSP